MAESSPQGQTTLWEKEKLLITSNFSFFPVFSKDLYCRPVKTRAKTWERVKLPHKYKFILTNRQINKKESKKCKKAK